jgi:ATP-dependent helicase/nuclease subunit A
MSAPRKIPDSVIAEQLRASDPAVSAWVTANAGSGKTHVLTQRVISLLLKGEDPAKILCITFTKAAAANMAARVFDTLAEWTTLDDTLLDRRIIAIGGTPGIATRARARRLFALALETPGGLKVQTIHAFCTRLLHQFPFEADVAARFTVLDEATEHQLLEKLILDVMLEGASNRESGLGRALQIAIAAAADQTLHDVIRDAIKERDAILHWVTTAGSVEKAASHLSEALGINPAETTEGIDNKLLAESLFSPHDWPDAAALLAQGSKADCDQAAIFAKLHTLSEGERREALLSIFLTKDRSPRARLATKKIADASPILVEKMLAEQRRICALLEQKNALICRDKTLALLAIAHEIIKRYRIEKDRRGLLDYDDLIDRTLALFRKTSAAWVLFKLDLGVNHVLIDEAQDTSPKQWEIISTLVSEFTAGAGARPVERTMFAVGDDKQSIFSFQGAAPEKFADMQRNFGRDFAAAALELRTVKLQTSFRSGEIVLKAVDQVFAHQTVHKSLTSDAAGMPPHIALPETAPGCVDIWPLTRPDPKGKPEGWDAPFDIRSETSPQVRLAQRIARNVSLWTDAGTKPGDVLILVRQRGALFEAIIRALKGAHIPVAGADRLVLTEHIAVMDLIVLADALLLPENDLALATTLKSPLFGLTEDELFRIAWGRNQTSLRRSLLAHAGEDSKLAEAASQIERLSDEARRLSPFTFYAQLLGPRGGRRHFLARLGPEANDALDEFLNLALDYESRETPSLQGFVSWLRAAQAEVKRDMEQDRDEVRVMTVHGAKGLEAPTVILADTTTRPAGYHPPRLIPLNVNGAVAPVWVGNKASDPAVVADARATVLRANEDEYRRLLYVGMTRAQQRLVICGISGKPSQNDPAPTPPGCWYQLVETALVKADLESSHEIDAEDGDGRIWRYLKSKATSASGTTAASPRHDSALPDWLTYPAPTEAPRIAPLSPSEAWDDDRHPSSGTQGLERRRAIRRGSLVHRLMQSLPDIPASRRHDIAHSYLQRADHTSRLDEDMGDAERDTIVAQVIAMLDNPDFGLLFAPGSRAEVPLVGRISRESRAPLSVSGQVDRLIVTPDSVLIADYKTNHAPPRNVDEAIGAHPKYVLQLALYRALLSTIYPDRPVRAALVWTETPYLMEIPGHALDTALRPLTSP